MSAPMNPGAASPDEPLTDPAPMTLRDVRDVLDRVQMWISDGYHYDESMESDGNWFTGKDMVEDAQRAESFLYLLERK